MVAMQRLASIAGPSTWSVTHRKVIMGHDIATATRLLKRPWLPYYPLSSTAEHSFSTSFQEQTIAMTSTTLQTFVNFPQGDVVRLYDIFRRLRAATLALVRRDLDMVATQIEMYSTAYRMAVATAQACERGASETLSVFEAIVLSSTIFLWQRMFTNGAGNTVSTTTRGPMLRFCTALSMQHDNIGNWGSHGGLMPLLWCLNTVGGDVYILGLRPQKAWVARELRKVVDALGLETFDEYERVLKLFPYSRGDIAKRSLVLWDSIQAEGASNALAFSGPSSRLDMKQNWAGHLVDP